MDSDAAELHFLKCVSEMLSHWFKGRRAGRPQTLQGCVSAPDSGVPHWLSLPLLKFHYSVWSFAAHHVEVS